MLDGKVTDFIDVGVGAPRWPTFNLADSFIIRGMLVLMWTVFSMRRHPEKTP
jgi:lipoprotein signal peptidase